MRQATKSAIGILSLGVLASSYSIGLANANENAALIGATATATATTEATTESSGASSGAAVDSTATATPGTEATTNVTAEAGATAEPSATSSSSSSSSSSTTSKATTSSKATATATPTATATAAPKATATSTPTATAAASGTKTGDAIYYKYGTVQLAVTKVSGKITAIDVVVGTTKGREWAGVIDELVPIAISANGTGFSNYSGATFTTSAFKQALESALAK